MKLDGSMLSEDEQDDDDGTVLAESESYSALEARLMKTLEKQIMNMLS